MVKYSIIIPVYNSEKTIARCLDSLLCQERNDIEIIAVNDGSSDCSEQILLEYAPKYPVIHYVFQKNAGVSEARNTGLRCAKGTYITFVDSDDYVTADYFAELDRAPDCDLLVFAHENVGGMPLDESALFDTLSQAETSTAKLELLLGSRKIMSPCNKRFRRSLIQDNAIQFIAGLSVGEDFNFCMAYAMQSHDIQIVRKSLLCVDVADQDSLSRRYRPNLDTQLAKAFEHIVHSIQSSVIYQDKIASLLAITDYLFVRHVFSCILEEFKTKQLCYFRNRKMIASICKTFETPISDGRCSAIHFVLRLLLKWRIYWPFYAVSYWARGRKYKMR